MIKIRKRGEKKEASEKREKAAGIFADLDMKVHSIKLKEIHI